MTSNLGSHSPGPGAMSGAMDAEHALLALSLMGTFHNVRFLCGLPEPRFSTYLRQAETIAFVRVSLNLRDRPGIKGLMIICEQ